MKSQHIDAAEGTIATISKLVDRSYSDYIDIEKDLDWKLGINRDRFPKRQDTCWLYGTPYWENQNHTQRVDVAWKETARDVSMFIWLEQLIPPLYIGYVNRLGDSLSPSIRDYLMIFCKEEILHTLMFRRFLSIGNLPLFRPMPDLFDLFQNRLPRFPPLCGIVLTYLGETIAEFGAMYNTDFQEVDVLTRIVIREHHREEARHIAFGRLLIESNLESNPMQAEKMQPLVETFLTPFVKLYNYDPEIRSWLSSEISLPSETQEELDLVRTSANNRRLTTERFGSLLRWLRRWRLVSETYTWGMETSSQEGGVS